MKRRKRRQPEALRRYWAARRGKKNAPRRRRARANKPRRARRNYMSAGALANRPPRRRRLAGVPRRNRRYRSNPQVFGFGIPDMQTLFFTGAGIVVPPLVTSFIMQQLPEQYRSSKPVYYAVKVASVLVPSMVVKRFVNARAGNLMLIGGAASFLIDLVREFAPGMIPGIGYQPMLGYYHQMRPARALGAYPGRGNLNPGRRANNNLSPILTGVPERLMPTARF